MKIYTRTGDTGTTALFGGGRVAKAHPLIEAYGTVDEANAALGMARLHTALPPLQPLDEVLARLQRELFVVGADLATPLDARPTVPRVRAAHIEGLEALIDRFEEALPPLKHFVLPGGSPAAAALHVARTVVRRAERRLVEAGEAVTTNAHALTYLNRLSDLLFVLARWANHAGGIADVPWHPPSSQASS